MRDEEYLNILTYGRPTGTIKIEPHPKDVIDVDPMIISNMKARIKNEPLEEFYSRKDQIIDEVSLVREKNKLKKVFENERQIHEAYSSIQSIKLIKQELELEEVNRELLSDYALVKSKRENVDEVDFYKWFLFGSELHIKSQRLSLFQDSELSELFDSYQENHFNILSISKEMIQMNTNLLSLFKERRLASVFNEFLCGFYGVKL